MNDDRVIPITIDNCYANTNKNSLDFSLRSGVNIIENPGDYNLVVDKMTLPLLNVPIGLNVKYDIWFDSLDKNNKPSKFQGGDILNFPFVGTYSSLREFVEKLNNHLDSILESYNYAKFSVINDLISYEETIANKQYVKIYIGKNLRRVLDELSDFPSFYINGIDFYELTGVKNIDYIYNQTVSTLELICSLQKFKIYSDLPTSNHYSYDMSSSSLKIDNLLTDIDFNPQSMAGNKSIKYLPTVLREYSLRPSSPINNFRLWFTSFHSNGEEEYIIIDDIMYSSINIRFMKKENIIKDVTEV